MVRKPAILLLDEATSALDSNSESIVQAALDEASKECTTKVPRKLTFVLNLTLKIRQSGKNTTSTLTTVLRFETLIKKNMEQEDYKYEKVQTSDAYIDELRPVSYFELYKFSTNFDKLLLAVAVLLGACSGISEALFIVILGRCVGTIAKFGNDLLALANETEKVKVEEIFQDKTNEFAIFTCTVAIAIFIATYVSTSLFNYTAAKQAFKIRELYFFKVLNQDISWHDQISTRDFASRLVDDLRKIEEGINDKAAIAVIQFSIIVVSIVQSLIIGWKLTLVCLLSLPISYVMMTFIGKLSTNLFVDEMEAYGKAVKLAEETLTYIKTVVAFNGQKKEIKRYNRLLSFVKNNNIKRYFFIGLTNGVTNFFVCFGMVLSLWYGVRLLLQEGEEHYSIDRIVMVYNSVWTATHNIGATTPFLVLFNAAKGAATRIFSVIDNEPFINQSYSKGIKITELKGNISFRDVSFSYPARPEVEVLKNFNLEINAGETVALVGSSGCGKSTVIQLIQRFYDVNRGQICLDGNDIKDLNLKSVREKIAVVGQEPVLFGGTIARNIKLGKLSATQAEVEEAARRSNADLFIRSFTDGYRTVIGDRRIQMSEDQKRRISIARALIRKPAVLLLDEATSAFDSKGEASLDEFCQDCTTVIVAHRLSTIRQANRIVVLENGTVVEEGSHDELMLVKGTYHKLVQTQSRGEDETIQPVKEHPNNIITLKKDQAKKRVDFELATVWKILNANVSPKWCMIAGILCSMTYILSATGCLYFLGRGLAVMTGVNAKYILSRVNIYSGCILGLALIVGVSSVFQSYFIGIAGENLTANLRSSMFKSMVHQDMGWFDRKENGVASLSARLAGEPSSVQNAISFCAGAFINAITAMFSLILVGVYLCWKLLLGSLGFIPVLLVLLYLEQKVLVKENRRSSEVMEQAAKLALEAIGNVRTVASLAVEKSFHNLYMLKLKLYESVTIRTIHIQGVVYGLSRSAFPLSYIITMYYGAYLIRNNETNAASVIALTEIFVVYLWLITYSLVYFSNMTRGFVACNQIYELLSLKPEAKISSNTKLAEPSINQDLLQYSALSFSYPTRPNVKILDGFDLSVMKAKTVALVGPSGCGKSTVIQLLQRFYDCNSGYIAFKGRDISKENLDAHRLRLGIVMQKPTLFSRTIGENIAYGNLGKRVSKGTIIAAAQKANIHNFITSLPLGYETVLGEKRTQLSEGQKQRIAIARALVRNPEILLLDEVTSALDPESEKAVQEAVNKARRKRTCIVIAHRLKTIIDSNLIVVMNKGKVAEKGSHQELMNLQGLYWHLYNLQEQC